MFACAKSQTPEPPPAEGQADARWRQMLAIEGVTGPYRDQLSIRFGKEGDTRRVTAILWGNSGGDLRMDVMAGVGALAARIKESDSRFTIFAPRENKAYFHEGDNKPLLKLGVPAPLNLFSLSALLNGHYADVFGREFESALKDSQGLSEYRLIGKFAGALFLNEKGLPVEWRQEKGGWTLKLGYDDSAPTLPHSLRLTNEKGQRAIILVKERETPAQSFTAGQMELNLPEGTPILPLSQFRTPKSGAFGD